jgi:hypothetical protein
MNLYKYLDIFVLAASRQIHGEPLEVSERTVRQRPLMRSAQQHARQPTPGKELIEAIVGPQIDQANESIGKPSLGVHAGQLGRFDQRGENGPASASCSGG